MNQAVEARKALTRADALRAKVGFGPITAVATANFDFKGRWPGKRIALKEGLAIAGAPRGGEWLQLIVATSKGREIKGATSINALEARALHDRGAIFIDTQVNWFDQRIPGSYFLEWAGTEGWLFNEIALGELADKNQEIVIYSLDPLSRTAPACALAVSRGFKNIYYFQGGLDAWKAEGYPVETGKIK